MRFKLDENLPAEAADVFRRAEHDAATVLEQEMGGAPDPNVAAVCQRESRALVTLDTDFADIRSYPPSDYPGLVVLRLRQQDKPHVLGVLERMLPLLNVEPLDRRLWIVGEERVRVRS
ncbi:DUF5615 family PIN-like protein [Rubrivirga litoralis]|uniref:DUF5615 family PIN-like protein n=1 Tax=Rubrivirga litoralis TaxID=3075598 RepID=A0ABU3BTA8_9BACT|nr:DUF5615 family PIN-like protein [Rubrivirga sp. F394]MDT0632515.1 DUF5615 family PIN-like protein [Rubrivirga sp. F394]